MNKLRAFIVVSVALLLAAASTNPTTNSAMPNCQGAEYLQYNTSTLAFSCGTPGGGSLPSGIVAAFNVACPSGWTEVTAAQGRVIVGLPSGGTMSGTVGTALTNLQDKTHSHTYTDVVNHTHVVNVTDNGHTHLTQRYPTATGSSSGFTIDTSMSGTLADNTLPTKTATTGITAATVNPAGGVATGTTATKATSDVLSYIQFRYCSKD